MAEIAMILIIYIYILYILLFSVMHYAKKEH